MFSSCRCWKRALACKCVLRVWCVRREEKRRAEQNRVIGKEEKDTSSSLEVNRQRRNFTRTQPAAGKPGPTRSRTYSARTNATSSQDTSISGPCCGLHDFFKSRQRDTKIARACSASLREYSHIHIYLSTILRCRDMAFVCRTSSWARDHRILELPPQQRAIPKAGAMSPLRMTQGSLAFTTALKLWGATES